MYRSSLLDGAQVEAVENYLDPKAHQFEFGVTIYPFNAYYTDIAVELGYLQNLGQSFSWEVVQAQLFSAYQSGLTSQLAQNYSVNPVSIPRLNYILASNFEYYFFYGKFIFFKNAIRYLRGSVILGGGVLGATNLTEGVVNGGVAFEILVTDFFSLKLSVRDTVGIQSLNNYVIFGLSTGLSF